MLAGVNIPGHVMSPRMQQSTRRVGFGSNISSTDARGTGGGFVRSLAVEEGGNEQVEEGGEVFLGRHSFQQYCIKSNYRRALPNNRL